MTTDRTFSRAWRFRWGHVDAYLAEQAARAAPALVLLKDEWDDFGLIGSASWHANKEAHAALNRAAPAQPSKEWLDEAMRLHRQAMIASYFHVTEDADRGSAALREHLEKR